MYKTALFFLIISILCIAKPVFAGSYCFNRAGSKYGINPGLIYAIAQVESGFNPAAVDYDSNGTYDYGVMQINTIWYKTLKPYWNNLADPCYNVMVGTWILKQCFHRYHGTKNALECYNSGKPHGDRAYADKVLLTFNRE
ncbi:MAG: lytic transglycosylase domain-containing protein [bacterium]